jgi:hypothetical protein
MVADDIFDSKPDNVNRVWRKRGDVVTKHIRPTAPAKYKPRTKLASIEVKDGK